MRPEHERALYLDLEYTCWEDNIPPQGVWREVIQVGIVEVNFLTMAVTRTSEFWVKPIHPISSFCSGLTGITHEKIKRNNGRNFVETMNSLRKMYGPSKKVTYTWGEDDETVLREAYRYECLDWFTDRPEFNIINLSLVFHHMMGLRESISLDKALEYYDKKFEGEMHTAKTDAYNLSTLHMEMIRRLRVPVSAI